ncbi:putative secreted hydrolase [Burkholderiales bacterium JOSHI_001]|nr:putative secreted hydrolase [Burkholderiales bacterium JOSHI_001]
MNPRRRAWLLALAGGAPATWAAADAADPPDPVRAGRALVFPRDHGAHPTTRTEWWYATGWLQAPGQTQPLGFQVTFFRSRTGLGDDLPGRFAPRQLLFAHAAVTDIVAGRHRHAQRMARWSGDEASTVDVARRADTHLRIGTWSLQRDAATGRYSSRVADTGAGFTLDLDLQPTQPLLRQGQDGFSRKGPLPQQASHYYSQPQLKAQARLTLDGRALQAEGRAWLDHEWSDEILSPAAVGWDWVGFNLADGAALTAFVLRQRDGSPVWAGGSFRAAGGAVQAFGPEAVRFEPLRHWQSGATGARYPVQWRLHTPAGVFEVAALLDAQELDGRAGTGAVYWEGLSELKQGPRRIGLGYLEMTGYAGRITL